MMRILAVMTKIIKNHLAAGFCPDSLVGDNRFRTELTVDLG